MAKQPDVVVITGASAGVGRATACEFAKQGADIALLARGDAGLEGAREDVERLGGHPLVLPTDVADHEQVDAAALEVENLEDAITRLEERKISYDKVDSPVCRMAIIEDPDGNKLMIHKLKSENEKEVCK